jgi:hypothetical protein
MSLKILTCVTLAVAALMASLHRPNSSVAADASSPVDVSKLPVAAERDVDFAKDIQPIFAKSCHSCHGPETQEAGLRLDLRKAALAGGDSGPVIVAGRSAHSRLIHLAAGLDEETGLMPPEGNGDALTSLQIGLLRKWIDSGANWPDELAGEDRLSAANQHWSFQPIVKPEVPTPSVQGSGFKIRNAIDAFVLTKLEREKVEPSVEADRATLVRRVYLDLIGLPPTPVEVNAFLADDRPNAYEQLVDRLLDSPHYGERWARYWLDLARYADSDGYEKDMARPFAWRYRDWVINSLNRDMPFDVFTVQQIAGDLLSADDPEYDDSAPVATGFHRNSMINREAGIDAEEDRVKRTIDRTNTTGTVWLGLTVGCANCHSHKYDPISQREYFGLYAFFNNLREVDASVETGKRSAPKHPYAVETANTLVQEVSQEPKLRETYVHLRGDFLSKGPLVEPATPAILPPLKARDNIPDRLDLARWLVDGANPLTARVLANRLWQWHFGRALAVSSDDFGKEGERPSHPELLDWLAAKLRDSGWKLKQLHRLIVTSATYRQSSNIRPELAERDPYNSWLARQNRFRVEAETVRDLALAASGLMNDKVGGSSIRPPQPASIGDLTYSAEKDENKWVASTGDDRYRRGLYIWIQRTRLYHSLGTFDAPDANLACTRRERSNTPLQALTLLNDVVFLEAADALGRKMAAEFPTASGASDVVKLRIDYAFRRCLSRSPTPDEAELLGKFYDNALTKYRQDPAAARALLNNSGTEATDDSKSRDDSHGTEAAEIAACVNVARAIMNLDEFLTRE